MSSFRYYASMMQLHSHNLLSLAQTLSALRAFIGNAMILCHFALLFGLKHCVATWTYSLSLCQAEMDIFTIRTFLFVSAVKLIDDLSLPTFFCHSLGSWKSIPSPSLGW